MVSNHTFPRQTSHLLPYIGQWQLAYQIAGMLLIFLLTACQALPPNHRVNTPATIKGSPPYTPLIYQISASNNPSPRTLSGYYPLVESTDAFAARSVLSDMATQSIDVQYYIWHNDAAGQLMLKDLYEAANRGVKVRLLLDDLNTNLELDQQLLAFSAHPNIQVRLINPKVTRTLSPANFLVALPRYQRRMHNKSMSFDRQIAIIGGRNIGDEYLRNDTQNEFADLDVLLAGKVVEAVEQSFEQYWNSDLSYDIEQLVTPAKNPKRNKSDEPFLDTLTAIAPTNNQSTLSKSSQLYRTHDGAMLDDQLYNKKIPFRWQPIVFFADDVTKLRNQDDKATRLVAKLRSQIGTPTQRFTIISSYFVPTNLGVQQLKKLVDEGVKVSVLTNAYEATDVPIVHSGYSVARAPLLQAGVSLYELKSSADPDFRHKKRGLYKRGLYNSKSSTSLHTKAFAVDDTCTFIGSYNVDPRSANINTELGVLIYDKALTRAVHAAFDEAMLNISYRVQLTPDQQLQWQTHDDRTNQHLVIYDKEPRLSTFHALWVRLFAKLPFRWLL